MHHTAVQSMLPHVISDDVTCHVTQLLPVAKYVACPQHSPITTQHNYEVQLLSNSLRDQITLLHTAAAPAILLLLLLLLVDLKLWLPCLNEAAAAAASTAATAAAILAMSRPAGC